MKDFDMPMDRGPKEPQCTLPWESIDPDDPAVAVIDSGIAAPQVAHDADHDWAATAFLADEQELPATPMASSGTRKEGRAEEAADPSPEEKTPWNELEPVMAEITAPQVGEPDIASTFVRSDSILAAASELATLAESMQTSPAQEAEVDAISFHARIEESEAELAATVPQLDLDPIIDEEMESAVELDVEPVAITTHGGWTIPLMCLGIGLIACCVIIPQGDFNRRLRYEQTSLETNLKSIEKQAAVNEEFLKKVADDPELTERLSGRQLKTIRKGQKIIPLDNVPGQEIADMSPFGLVAVAPPQPQQPYRPARGTIADLCNNARARLYLLGTATMMVALGLVMGFGEKKTG